MLAPPDERPHTHDPIVLIGQRRAWIAVACAAGMLFTGSPAALGAKRAPPPKAGERASSASATRPGGSGTRRGARRSRSAATSTWPRRRRPSSRSTWRRSPPIWSTGRRRRPTPSPTPTRRPPRWSRSRPTSPPSRWSWPTARRSSTAGPSWPTWAGRAARSTTSSLAGQLLSLPSDLTDAARRTEIVKGVSQQDNDAYDRLIETQDQLARDEVALTAARDRAKRSGPPTPRRPCRPWPC